MKLLLVEDDPELGTALCRSLRAAGFDTEWAQRLRSAEQHAATFSFHCIVLDLQLPDGEGFTLLETLRRRGRRVPVLVMTARAGLPDRLRALDGGADDYVVKPFATEELIARLHALIRRAHGFAGQAWRVGDLELDVPQQQARVQGGALALTPREFAILRELAMAGGRVVRREALVDRVWGCAEMPSDGAIEFQLHGLRRKLGAQRIRTVRGVGYALVVQPGA
jgi:DNA-binding response OmpR family regulator